jgi:hypothetical protein
MTKADELEQYRQLGDISDLRDALNCLSFINMVTRCPGGRIIVAGYLCLHCGADADEPCRQPKPNPKRNA